MKYFSMLDISFSQMQMFLAVAERGSITQAANTLHMTQSAVSKNIKYLEDTLGLYLFIREKQALKLTPAGRLLKEEFSNIYTAMERALEKAHVLQTGSEKPITVGIPDSANLQKIFLNMKERLLQHQIEANLHIECLPFNELGTKLLNGAIDIVITCGFDSSSFADCQGLVMSSVPAGCYFAYMDRQNPLGKKDAVSMKELQASPFLIASPFFTPAYEQLILGMCRKAGFYPRISKYLTSPNAFVCNFDTGLEVFIADAYMRESENPQLVKVPIADTQSTMTLIRREVNDNLSIPYLYDAMVKCWEETSKTETSKTEAG